MLPMLSTTALTPIPLLAVGCDPILDEVVAGAKGAPKRDGHHGLTSPINPHLTA